MSDSWAIDPADAEAALVTLRGAKTVLMPMHQNVDADGLSSPLAMRHALAAYGVEAYPLITRRRFSARTCASCPAWSRFSSTAGTKRPHTTCSA